MLFSFVQDGKTGSTLKIQYVPGAIAEKLMSTSLYSTICDSTLAALDLWSLAKNDIPGYIDKAAQRSRLRDKKLDDCIGFCLTADYTKKIPVIKDGVLVSMEL